MIILLVIIFSVFFMILITALKLYDCGVSAGFSFYLSLKMYKFIQLNISLSLKALRKNDPKESLFYIVMIFKYKSYLEMLSQNIVRDEYTLKILKEKSKQLTPSERLRLNTWIRNNELPVKITKNNELKFNDCSTTSSNRMQTECTNITEQYFHKIMNAYQ